MKNLMKKNKKRLLLALLILSCVWLKSVNAKVKADFIVKEYPEYAFYYDNERYTLSLYEEKDSHLPVFQDRPRQSLPTEQVYDVQETNRADILDEHYNMIYLSGQVASEENALKRVAVQLALFEYYASLNKKTFSLDFDATEIKKIENEIREEALKLLDTKEINMSIFKNVWTTINFPNEASWVMLNSKSCGTQNINNKTFEVRSTFNNTNAYIRYYDINKTERKKEYIINESSIKDLYPIYIEVTTPKTSNLIYNFRVKEKKDRYKISKKETKGVKLEVNADAAYNETVNVVVNLSDGYDLESLYYEDPDGNKVDIIDNKFTMPEDDVTVKATVKKKDYSITTKGEHVTFNVEQKALFDDNVNIDYELEDGYGLDHLEVQTISGKDITILDNSFVMPSEDVLVSAYTEANSYEIRKNTNKLELNIQDTAKANEKVEFSYEIPEGFVLDKLWILTSSNKEVPIIDNSFVMPNENITIYALLKKEVIEEKHFIYLNYDKGANISIPSEALTNKRVLFSIKYDPLYELSNLEIKTKSGKNIDYKDNSFIMPNEDVYLNLVTKEKEFSILYNKDKGLTLKKDKFSWGKTVELQYVIDPKFKLLNFKIVSESGKTIPLNNNSFVMPKENVKILLDTEQVYYNVFLYNSKLTFVNSFLAKSNEYIDIPEVFSHIHFVFSEAVDIKNFKFKMPKKDISIFMFDSPMHIDIENDIKRVEEFIHPECYASFIRFKTEADIVKEQEEKKKEEQLKEALEKIKNQTFPLPNLKDVPGFKPLENYVYEDIPNTSKNNYIYMLLIPLISLIYVKKRLIN